MKTRTIRQTIVIHASAHDVYEMLMDEREHARFTGGVARISRDVGGTFVTNDGYSTGTNLELVQDAKIVQTWRAIDWPDDHHSRLTITLSQGSSGTKLSFIQAGVPSDQYQEISQGWNDYYWNPLKEALEKEM
ncbi:MAG: SRPBCC family protein [Methanoregula sp.]|jgi:activator of HSP90 ATPase